MRQRIHEKKKKKDIHLKAIHAVHILIYFDVLFHLKLPKRDDQVDLSQGNSITASLSVGIGGKTFDVQKKKRKTWIREWGEEDYVYAVYGDQFNWRPFEQRPHAADAIWIYIYILVSQPTNPHNGTMANKSSGMLRGNLGPLSSLFPR